ncbi:MAG TPA: DegT/DnrJ/EryC1/StrS family aminotransferase [Gaiellaceae bacterium]|nr:DegT/DnrJ/EryC1/StrS family aminotransferase [Gaiellaceae bacterium]
MAIPLTDVRAQYAPLLGELEERIAEVLGSGRFVLGPEVTAFEAEAARFLGVGHAAGVANGTDALILVLDALGVGPGDEVICPAFTFYATAEAVARRGATPVFADIDPVTLNLDPADVAAKVTGRTKAILPVHLFGRPLDVGLLAGGAPVVEDAAQAFGATVGGRRVGSLATAATFSFYPTKNLFGLGDGGLVTTGDEAFDQRIRLLRFHGSRDKRTFEAIGYNSRLDELQAAALRIFLRHLDEWNAARRQAAARYTELGLGEVCGLPNDEPGHVYHMYVVRTPERERLTAALDQAEIGWAAYYTTPLHLQPAFAGLGYREGSLPETERAARETLALPIWPAIEPGQQERVVECLRASATMKAA